MPARKRPRSRAAKPSGDRSSLTRPPKIQRWIDLVAALLRHHYGVSFDALRRDVPAYAEDKSRETILRMFERDKDELRELGVPIETVFDEDGEAAAYRLRRKDFYLPYLSATATAGAGAAGSAQRSGKAEDRQDARRRARPSSPRPAERAGYRDLPHLVFEPEELAAVADAADRVRQLENPILARDAESAIRKLAFDLPVGALAASEHVTIVPSPQRASDRDFELLDTALRRRKVAHFEYRSMERDETSRRDVEPYGLFFLGGHWYLAARDTARDALRNFRLSRIAGVEINANRPQSPDYAIPAQFDLLEHARSRQAWELGDGDAIEAVVAFRISDGATAAAARLGEAVDGDASIRRFRVRRVDPFVHWLLSFAGDAEPVSPKAVVESFTGCVRDTLNLYDQ